MVRLRNTSEQFGLVSLAFHWLAALAVLAILASAAAVWLAPGEAAAEAALRLHASLGMLFSLVILARMVWRLVERQPASLVTSRMQRSLASTVQLSMLVLIFTQLITGPLDIWSAGWPIEIVPGVSIASPFAPWPEAAHDALGNVHRWCGVTIMGLVGLHILAAVKHLAIDRDQVVPRMFGFVAKPDIAKAGAPSPGAIPK